MRVITRSRGLHLTLRLTCFLNSFSFFCTRRPIPFLSVPCTTWTSSSVHLRKSDDFFLNFYVREIRAEEQISAGVEAIRGVVKGNLTEAFVLFAGLQSPQSFPIIIEPFSFQVNATRCCVPVRNSIAIQIIDTAIYPGRAGRFIELNGVEAYETRIRSKAHQCPATRWQKLISSD